MFTNAQKVQPIVQEGNRLSCGPAHVDVSCCLSEFEQDAKHDIQQILSLVVSLQTVAVAIKKLWS